MHMAIWRSDNIGIYAFQSECWRTFLFLIQYLQYIWGLYMLTGDPLPKLFFPMSLGSHHANIITINTLRPRQNGRHFADDVFKCIFLNENVWILLKILLKFVPKGPINNIPSLVQIMAWRRPGDKPLSVYWRIYASLGLNELITTE